MKKNILLFMLLGQFNQINFHIQKNYNFKAFLIQTFLLLVSSIIQLTKYKFSLNKYYFVIIIKKRLAVQG